VTVSHPLETLLTVHDKRTAPPSPDGAPTPDQRCLPWRESLEWISSRDTLARLRGEDTRVPRSVGSPCPGTGLCRRGRLGPDVNQRRLARADLHALPPGDRGPSAAGFAAYATLAAASPGFANDAGAGRGRGRELRPPARRVARGYHRRTRLLPSRSLLCTWRRTCAWVLEQARRKGCSVPWLGAGGAFSSPSWRFSPPSRGLWRSAACCWSGLTSPVEEKPGEPAVICTPRFRRPPLPHREEKKNEPVVRDSILGLPCRCGVFGSRTAWTAAWNARSPGRGAERRSACNGCDRRAGLSLHLLAHPLSPRPPPAIVSSTVSAFYCLHLAEVKVF